MIPGIVDDCVSVMRKLVVSGIWNAVRVVAVAIVVHSIIIVITIVIVVCEI